MLTSRTCSHTFWVLTTLHPLPFLLKKLYIILVIIFIISQVVCNYFLSVVILLSQSHLWQRFCTVCIHYYCNEIIIQFNYKIIMQTAHALGVPSTIDQKSYYNKPSLRIHFIHLHRQMIIVIVRIITKLPAYNNSISTIKCIITYSPPLIIAIYFQKSLVRIHPLRESNLTNIRVVPYMCGIYRESQSIQVFNANIKSVSKYVARYFLKIVEYFLYKMTQIAKLLWLANIIFYVIIFTVNPQSN